MFEFQNSAVVSSTLVSPVRRPVLSNHFEVSNNTSNLSLLTSDCSSVSCNLELALQPSLYDSIEEVRGLGRGIGRSRGRGRGRAVRGGHCRGRARGGGSCRGDGPTTEANSNVLKRGPGRPRKHVPDEEVIRVEVSEPVKRKPGRPRKAISPPSTPPPKKRGRGLN